MHAKTHTFFLYENTKRYDFLYFWEIWSYTTHTQNILFVIFLKINK